MKRYFFALMVLCNLGMNQPFLQGAGKFYEEDKVGEGTLFFKAHIGELETFVKAMIAYTVEKEFVVTPEFSEAWTRLQCLVSKYRHHLAESIFIDEMGPIGCIAFIRDTLLKGLRQEMKKCEIKLSSTEKIGNQEFDVDRVYTDPSLAFNHYFKQAKAAFEALFANA